MLRGIDGRGHFKTVLISYYFFFLQIIAYSITNHFSKIKTDLMVYLLSAKPLITLLVPTLACDIL